MHPFIFPPKSIVCKRTLSCLSVDRTIHPQNSTRYDDGYERVRSGARGADRRKQTTHGGNGHRVARRANHDANADAYEEEGAGALFSRQFYDRDDVHNALH